jgi:hypothetical protein
MAPAVCADQAPIPPPSYHRSLAGALHLDALTLVRRLQLLALCELAVQLAQQQCPPPLPAGPGGAPRIYREESLLLLAVLRTLWRLSFQELHDWLCAWPTLALACGLPLGLDGQPRVPSKSQQSKRLRAAGAPASEMLFVLLVRAGLWMGLTRARDLIIDSAPILAWRRADPDAAYGHAPAHHPRPLLLGIPCCAAGPACRCCSCSRAPMSTTPPSPGRCWSWPSACSPCARGSCAWMPATGGSI